MDDRSFKTHSLTRLRLVRPSVDNLHWLFLPGGPGLGSESLTLLLKTLQVPGNFWLVDLPGDGSNITSNPYETFSHWSSALVEAVSPFCPVILVAHSTGGMYTLSTPELENKIDGLILLDTAPNASWQISFGNHVQKNPIPESEVLQKKHHSNPSNSSLKALTLASAPYLFTEEGMVVGMKLLESLPDSFETTKWSEDHFDSTYTFKWVPKTLPTLILSAENDLITPIDFFRSISLFHRENIVLQSIPKAGHFPWIDRPLETAAAFNDF